MQIRESVTAHGNWHGQMVDRSDGIENVLVVLETREVKPQVYNASGR